MGLSGSAQLASSRERTMLTTLSGALERLAGRVTQRAAYALVAASVVASALLAGQLYREVGRELTDLVVERRAALAQLATTTFSERIDRVTDLAASLASRVRFAELVSAGQWEAASRIVRKVPGDFRLIESVTLYDVHGTPMTPGADGTRFERQDLGLRDWLRSSSGGKPYVSGIHQRDSSPSRPAFAVAVPISDRDGAPSGILHLQVRLEPFFDWARSIDFGAGGAITVVDAKGMLAFHSAAAAGAEPVSLATHPAVARVLRGFTGVDTVTDPADGTQQLIAAMRSPHGWGVIVQQPAVNAFAARDNQLLRLLAGYALILAFVAAIGGLGLHLLRQHKQMRALNRELDDLYDQAPCGYHSVDRDGRIARINQTWLGWLGYTRAEVIGRMTHADLMTPRSAEYFWNEAFPLFKQQGWLKDVEFEYRRKDGSTFPAALNATSVRDEKGGLIMSRSTVVDATERKRSEAEIKALNTRLAEALTRDQRTLSRHAERLRILAEIDRAVVAGRSADEIAQSVIRPLRELLGVPRAIVNRFDLEAGEVEWIAAAGRRRTHAGPGVRYSLALMGDIEALRRGQAQFVDVAALPEGPEVQALLASGVRTYVAVPMIAGGELLGAVSFGDDRDAYPYEDINIAQEVATQLAIALSQARLLDQVKNHAKDLEQRVQERTALLNATNRELEAFTYSVSHDLRAPLRAVDGYARMLEEDYAERLDDEGRRLLAVVRDSSRRMGRLIDDLLGFARLGRQVPAKHSLDMTALAREVGAEVGGPIEVAALPSTTADRALLRQVWVNLIGNAVKYSSKRPAPRVEVGGREEAGECVYWVRDNGAGFDMRYAAKLFGVFQRLHREDEFPGTGVGLAIVERIVARHGGRVWAEGRPDDGACFYFALPR